jgi:hypothetical protein
MTRFDASSLSELSLGLFAERLTTSLSVFCLYEVLEGSNPHSLKLLSVQ